MKEKTKYRIIAGIIIFSLLIGPSGFQLAIGAVTFSSSLNLSNTADTSINLQIVALANNVYVVWQENLGTGEVFFNASSNRGTSFIPGSSINLSGDATHDSQDIKMALYEKNVYLVWHNDTTTANEENIAFIRSTNNGTSFESFIDISGKQTFVAKPQLAISGETVYVLWENGSTGDILVDARPNNGTLSTGIENISNDADDSSQGKISAIGDNVYVAWRNATASDVFFARSTDGGDNFGSASNISSDAQDSQEPVLTSVGSNVYVAWRNDTATDNVAFTRSINDGATFSTPVNIGTSTGIIRSDSIQILATGTNVYVVWANTAVGGDSDVYIATSNDSGQTFNDPIDLSGNSGQASQPSISSSGSNVYVAWQDSTPSGVTTNEDILFKFSTNNGQDFCGSATNVSNDGTDSEQARLASTSDRVYLAWKNGTGIGSEIFFKAADTPSSDCIEFDESQYTLNDQATITVTDSAQSGSINVAVTSDSDSSGITVNLPETGVGTGVFTGQISFSETSSSGSTLKAKAGDAITATFGANSGTASIYPISFVFSPGAPTLSSIITIEVTDLNSNKTASIEQIDISVTSSSDSSGTTLRLTETDPKTGVFTNSGGLILMTGNDLFSLDDEITISLVETGSNVQNADVNDVDKISMSLVSSTDPTGITIVLTETGVNTGTFENETKFSSTGPSAITTLHASEGDIVSLSFLGEVARGLITPNSDASRGAIQAATGDTISATYKGEVGTKIITPGSGGGGGGGGLIRPGLVVDILAGVSIFGGGRDTSPPALSLEQTRFQKSITIPQEVRNVLDSFDPNKPIAPMSDDQTDSFDFPLKINDNSYPLAGFSNTLETYEAKTSEPIKMRFTLLETSNLMHFTMYTNLGKSDDVYESDTYLTFHDGEYIIADPNKFFGFAKINVEDAGSKKFIDIELIFDKPMDKSNIIIRAWDNERHSGDVHIVDAIQIDQSENTPELQKEVERTSEDTPKDQTLTEEQITPNETSETIVRKESVLEWAGYSPIIKSDKEILEEAGIQGETIPKWFKNNFGKWVFTGQIQLVDFEKAIKYLNERGVIY